MMMPPKKSKAARKGKPKEPEEESLKDASMALDSSEDHGALEEKDGSEDEAEGLGQDEPKEKKTPEKKAHFNVFDVTTVDGKRKRHMPVSEQVLNDWIDSHCETREETRLSIPEVYNCYLEMCVASASVGVDQTIFGKIMRTHFPKGFGFKEGSPYFGQVKERKVQKKVTKVKADTLNLKMRDIVERSLEEFGNPKNGIRFNKILTYIAGKYPALRIELRPKMLLNGLQRGLRFGYITCEKGIGRCGFYRKYVADEEEEDDEKGSKETKSKEEREELADGGDGEKQKDGEDGKDVEENGAGEATKRRADDSEDKGPTKKKKKGIPAKRKKSAQKMRFIQHSNPKRLEDTFYLGMTFMSEPKEASVGRIKKYIQENYQDVNVDSRLKKCLEIGKERGYWEQMTGSGTGSGTFRLLVDEFDPSDDDDLIGMVVNAIMAGTEPKMCSANLLKKYVMEWFSDKFKLAERPHLFKKALERAVSNNEIRQLSGIGASGTFQLAKHFYPSPLILAGQDTESDYEEDSGSDSSEEERTIPYDFANYGDAYKPRPSKRRGMARAKAVHAKPAVEITAVTGKKSARRFAKKRKRSFKEEESEESSGESSSEESSSEEEEEEEEEEQPTPKPRSRAPAKSGHRQTKPAPMKATPSKKKPASATKQSSDRRNRGQSSQKDTERNDSAKRPSRSQGKQAETPSRTGRSRPSYVESSSDEEYQNVPSRSRSSGQSRKKASSGHGRKTRMTDEDEIEPTKPRTPAAKKQGTAKTPSQSRARKAPLDSDDSNATEPEKYTPAPSKARGRRKLAESDEESEEGERKPSKSRGRGRQSRGSKSERVSREATDSSEDSDRDKTPSKPAKVEMHKTPAAKKQGSSPAPTKGRHRKK